MLKMEKIKYLKSFFLLFSTLFFPLQFLGISLYLIPSVYISIIVPYLLWKIWFYHTCHKIKLVSYLWKIPIIFLLAAGLFYTEIILIFVIPPTISLVGKIITFYLLLLLLRCLTYALMIFVWQPNILKSYAIIAFAGTFIYCLATVYFLYSAYTAPDTDNKEVLLSVHKLAPGNVSSITHES